MFYCLLFKAFTNTYKQKNFDFKKLFKLKQEEHLLVDYSCALQREILAHCMIILFHYYFIIFKNKFFFCLKVDYIYHLIMFVSINSHLISFVSINVHLIMCVSINYQIIKK